MTMRDWLRERPWIWIVLLLAVTAAFNLVLVVIAVLNQPIPV